MFVLKHVFLQTLFLKSRMLPVLTSALLLTSTAFSHDLKFDLLVGGDTNPNQLSEAFDADTSPYGLARLELSHMPVRTGFYYDFQAEATFIPADEEALSDPALGEETRGSAALGFKWRPKFDHGRARFKFEVFGKSKDGTYVDHSTGDIARFNRITPLIDDPIEDRFDYTISGFKTTGDIPLSADAFFIYDIDIRAKTYQDYPDFELQGLDNLDYEEFQIDFGFEKWIWPRTNLITMLGYGEREYISKPGVDVDGVEVPGSVLGFTFLEAVNAVELEITDRLTYKLGVEISKREDSEDGFYDMTRGEAFTGIYFRNPGYVKISLTASYSVRKFDNIEDVVPTVDDEDLREREGFTAKLELVRNMYQFTRIPFDVILGAEVKDYENSNPNFTYSRSQFYAGVRWRPFDL